MTPAITIIQEAALQFGDPPYSVVSIDEWLVYLNASQRDLARKLVRIKRRRALADVSLDAEYQYPSDLIQVAELEWSATPSDQTTFRKLREMFQDEFEDATWMRYPSQDPLRYHPRTESFALYPSPALAVAGGLRMTYWGLPDAVTGATTQPITVFDLLRDPLRERMVIYAERRDQRYDEAAAHEKEWEATLVIDRDQITDRTADRRSAVRPARRLNAQLRAR